MAKKKMVAANENYVLHKNLSITLVSKRMSLIMRGSRRTSHATNQSGHSLNDQV